MDETLESKMKQRLVKRWFCWGLAAVLLIMGILAQSLVPDYHFILFFEPMDTPAWEILYIGVAICLFFSVFTFGETRPTRNYLTADGSVDLATPRQYTPLQKPLIVRMLGNNPFDAKQRIETFDYADGVVTITTNKGNVFSGKLKDITVKYSLDKNKATDEWEPFKYKLTDADGNSISVSARGTQFEEEEWNDIALILGQANMDESKVSKFTRKADKVMGAVQDFDFTEIAGSAAMLASDMVGSASNPLVISAKKKIIDNVGEGTKSTFKKIKGAFVKILIVLAVLWLVFINLWGIIEEYRAEQKDMRETEAMLDGELEARDADEAYPADAEEVAVASAILPTSISFHGRIEDLGRVFGDFDFDAEEGTITYFEGGKEVRLIQQEFNENTGEFCFFEWERNTRGAEYEGVLEPDGTMEGTRYDPNTGETLEFSFLPG